MKILVSNDDGVEAPGLAALAAEMAQLGEVLVVAPDRDHSGASNSLTLDRPLIPEQLPNGFIRINGTPTDCVLLAVAGSFGFEPDVVVSGINRGANLGDDVIYSGTVAAALEGRTLGMPALAVSLDLRGGAHYATAARAARTLLQASEELHLPPRTVLNLNVPDLPWPQIAGWRQTRLGHRGRADQPVRMQDPRGRDCLWIASVGRGDDIGPDTDFAAVADGYISVTPLQVDMTQHQAGPVLREFLAGWIWQ